MINLRKHWKVVADDGDDPSQTQQPVDQSTMQTLTDGTAQQLCQRLWNGYVTSDNTNFANFMAQVDQVATSFVQALPIPVDPSTLEDASYDDSPDSLPSIGPTGPDANED